MLIFPNLIYHLYYLLQKYYYSLLYPSFCYLLKNDFYNLFLLDYFPQVFLLSGKNWDNYFHLFLQEILYQPYKNLQSWKNDFHYNNSLLGYHYNYIFYYKYLFVFHFYKYQSWVQNFSLTKKMNDNLYFFS